MLRNEDLQPLLETKTTVYGSDAEKIGALGQIYRDDGTDLPHFATVKTGLFGASESFVPLENAEISKGNLYLRFTKHFVTHAPTVESTGHLSPDDEKRLYDYYSQAGLGADKRSREPNTRSGDSDAAPMGPIQDTPLAAKEHVQTLDDGSGEPRARKYTVSEAAEDSAAGLNGTEPMVEDGRRLTEEGPETTEPRKTTPMDP